MSTAETISSDPPPSSARLSLRELEKGTSLWKDAWRRLKKNRAAVAAAIILAVMIVACILEPALSHWHYDQAELKTGATPPSWQHWMGTDVFGRDLMARVFFGGRISFGVGILATLT